MTRAMPLRLDEETSRRLQELEQAGAASRSAAVVAAINSAWAQLQEQRLEAAYEAAVADLPTCPYEDSGERDALRVRRNRRQQTSS